MPARHTLALLTLALALPAGAQEPAADPRAVQPERPTVATHAHTVAPGYVEIEAGVEADRYAPGRRALAAPIVTKVGLASHLQLNVSTPAYAAANGIGQSTGLGDIAIGLKWRLLDDAPVLGDFALLPTIKFPTGSATRGTGTGSRDVSLILISSHAFGPVAMDLNAAYSRLGATADASASDAALWTASFGFPIAGRLSWVAEIFGSPTIDGSGAPSTAALLTGPTFLLQPSFNLDLGLIAPLRGDQPNALYAGVVWNLGKLPFGWRAMKRCGSSRC